MGVNSLSPHQLHADDISGIWQLIFSTTYRLYNHRVILDASGIPPPPHPFTLMNDWEVGGKEGRRVRREYSPYFSNLLGDSKKPNWGYKIFCTFLLKFAEKVKPPSLIDFLHPGVERGRAESF